MFGGHNGEQGKMNDVYIIDLQSMVCELIAGTAYLYGTYILYKLVTEPRHVCTSVSWAHTCLSAWAMQVLGCHDQMKLV